MDVSLLPESSTLRLAAVESKASTAPTTHRRRPPQPWEAARRRNQMKTLGNINHLRKIERDAREAK